MIVGALKLVVGERADSSLIRRGATSCEVVATFDLSHSPAQLASINALLEESGISACEDGLLMVKREIGAKSRQYANCSPCTVTLLRKLGEHLVDLHGPHEHQKLLSQDNQLRMLDAYAQNQKEKDAYLTAYSAWARAKRDLETFERAQSLSSAEVELLRYQVDEIDAAELQPEAHEQTELDYRRAQNGTRLGQRASDAMNALSTATAALADVSRHVSQLHNSGESDSEVLRWMEDVDAVTAQLGEIDHGLQDYRSALDIAPDEMQRLEEEIETFDNLSRKYGTTVEEILAFATDARNRLDRAEGREDEEAALREEIRNAGELLQAKGERLSQARHKAGPKLSKAVARHLKDLGFHQALFQVVWEDLPNPGSAGTERVDFLFGPNPGEPMQPLRLVASSGEIARLMLAIKSALAKQDDTALLVFDEIDANVGGEIAAVVGEKLEALGKDRQILAITHMPQVASRSDQHFVVQKKVVKKQTVCSLRAMEGEERLTELARMLGGVSDQTKALAASLAAAS